jgi:hypothetical protein
MSHINFISGLEVTAPHKVRGGLRILVNQKFKWVPELNRPRSAQSQLPKDNLRSGGLVLLTQPAVTVVHIVVMLGLKRKV